MLLFRLCKDQDVVQVHYDNPFRYDSSEDVVHHSLEDSGAVGYSEEYYEGFEEASVGAKGHFSLISGVTNFIWPYLHQFFDDSHGLNGYKKPLKRPFDRYQSRLEAISIGRDIRQINW